MMWTVSIDGDPIDLDLLSQQPLGQGLAVVKRGAEYILQSSDFDDADDPNIIKAKAERLLTQLSGAIRLVIDAKRPLVISGVHRIRPDGTRDVFGWVEIKCEPRVIATAQVKHADGTVDVSSPMGNVGAWLTCGDPNIEKALRLRGTGDAMWVGLYRLLEVIENDAGGEPPLVAKNWASRNWLRLFRHTANSVGAAGDDARHGRETTTTPATPMPLEEARRGIDTILRHWLDDKVGGGAVPVAPPRAP